MKRWTTSVFLLLVLTGCAAQPTPPTPTPQTPPAQTQPAPGLTHLQMVDANTGWSWGQQGLFRTADGGKNWTDALPAGITGSPTDFTARDGATAWAAFGTVLFRTTDGGKTWQSSGFKGDVIRNISFQDEQHGWTLLSTGAATGGTELVNLYRTTDGGTTWTLTADNQVVENNLRNFPHPGMKTGITFIDDRRGFATGYLTQVSRLYFFATQDGGATWQPQGLALPELMTKAGPSGEGTITTRPPLITPDGALVLPVTSTRCADDQPCSVIYVSTDQGTTWQASQPLKQGLVAYDFIDSTHGWVTDGTDLQSTTDGGKTWTRQPLGPGVTAVDFIDAKTGWALAQPGLVQTPDGGRTWNLMH